MSSEIAVSVRNLTKTYRTFAHPGDRLKQALTFGRVSFHRRFTALEDVSFDVKRGEILGIIGRNGSGKSTLLQLICGILKPTAGSVQVNGRVSALLELGSGFNPEFTGRENVFFQGAIMGLSREEMAARFDDIAAFADIGEFIDQQVRTYSSGMYVRLAFAVSIHMMPDILVIDEALAVGDAGFQNKCLAAIKRFRDNGAAILLVSHDMGAVRAICDRAALIRAGRLMVMGSSGEVCDDYLRDIRVGETGAASTSSVPRVDGNSQLPSGFRMDETFMSTAASRYGEGSVKVTAVEVLNEGEFPIEVVEFDQLVKIRIHLLSKKDVEANIAYQLRDRTLTPILSSSALLIEGKLVSMSAQTGLILDFSTRLPVLKGHYSILVQVFIPNEKGKGPVFLDVIEHAAKVEVLPRSSHQFWSKVYLKNELTTHECSRE